MGQRITFNAGIMDPLTPTGAVMMGVYPYHLLGLGLTNLAELNLDVEGMAWSPFQGAVSQELFPRYSLALSHSSRFPDDSINPTTGYPSWPDSGLRRNVDFDENVLGFPALDETIVLDGEYEVSPADVFTSSTGTQMLPWPRFTETYTWRDTAISPAYTGGANGPGVPPDTVGLGNKVYPTDEVPSVALPLLARFRCFPEGASFSANSFQVQIMNGSSALPAFRVYSAGGRDWGGSWHMVIPDDRGAGGMAPIGGWNPSTGHPTRAYGPELYWTQTDFVLRVSRVVTHWFTFGGTLDAATPPFMEPGADLLPPGTAIDLEFRGSELVMQSNCGGVGPLTDATVLDAYGDLPVGGCGNLRLPGPWTEDLSDLVGTARFFQIRLTFLANADLGLEPQLDAAGFTWDLP